MTEPRSYPLLDRVRNPGDLRSLPTCELPDLAKQLRDFLLQTVARGGGHLAAGLGTVELAIALHYVFDTPCDSLVWDVGHQAYPHKILTGRRDGMSTIRRRGGLSGFLRREESPYDSFGAGHSSTSISAALGIAIANAHHGFARKSVAIIGDGGLTAGLAYEALEHAGSTDVDLLVILNDNGMSISPNVGAVASYLARLAGRAAPRDADRGSLFTALGFDYLGPCDGHDLDTLVPALQAARAGTGPRLLHVVTRKGHGYSPAALDPVKYHGVVPFEPAKGIVASSTNANPTFTETFGEWLCDMAARDPRVVAITPAMREGSGLQKFARLFPRRYFDVGIAEQHAVTLAAGLASQGLKPVVAIYSTFLQRAYDQLVHDVAIQRLPVLFAIDRGGLVGPDGVTHNGSFDLSYLRCLPGITVMTPADGRALRDMLHTGLQLDGPVAIRYPRASAGAGSDEPARYLPPGTAEVRRQGSGTALLVFGSLLATAAAIARELDATLVDMRFVKPLDTRLLLTLSHTHDLLVTIEENSVAGGAGSAVRECLAEHGIEVALMQLGLPDRHIEHGTRDEVLQEAGLDQDGMRAAIRRRIDLLDLRKRAQRSAVAWPTQGDRSSNGARSATIGGNRNFTASAGPSISRTDTAPRLLRRATTPRTSASGAEAPAVTPTMLASSTQALSSSDAS